MNSAIQVVFKNMKSSKRAKEIAREELSKIEELGSRIIHCRVTIEGIGEGANRHYKAHLFLNLPGFELSTDIDTADGTQFGALSEALHSAFGQLRHRLLREKDVSIKKHHRRRPLKMAWQEDETETA